MGERIDAWKSSDGIVFFSEDELNAYEASQNEINQIRQWIKNNRPWPPRIERNLFDTLTDKVLRKALRRFYNDIQ